VTLHHRLDGREGDPVLVLGSSLGTSLEMWEPQVTPLSRAFRVLRYDRRGHGGSAQLEGPATIGDLGADIVSLLDEHALEQVSFCGLSLGGIEGIWLAANAPRRVARLALCCTAASFAPPAPWLERAETVRRVGITAIVDAILGRWLTPGFRAAQPEVVGWVQAMLLATDAEAYARCCEALAVADLGPALRRITAPTLVLTAAEDPVVSPETGEALAAAIAGAGHLVLEDAAHLANVEQPDRFTSALLAHFAGQEVL
jgi:3-oxoadipate enol-lactonase